MKFTIKQMESEKTSFSTVDNHNLFCPSKQIRDRFYEAEKSVGKDNCSSRQSDFQDVVTESVPFRNSGVGEVYKCKYCMEESKVKEYLIAPCRCSGSLRYIHKDCLEWTQCSCPGLSRSDRCLYSVGIVSMFIVIGCLLALIVCFSQANPFAKCYAESKADDLVASSMNTNEINRAMGIYGVSTLDNIKIVCGILCTIFFAFCVLLAKSCKVSPRKFILRYLQSNKQWTILPYSASRDSLVTGNATNV